MGPMFASNVESLTTMPKIVKAKVQGPKAKADKSKVPKAPTSFMLFMVVKSLKRLQMLSSVY